MGGTEQHRTWRKANRDKVNKNSRAYLQRHFARYMLRRCRDSANKRGLSFNLTEEWIQERLDPGVCEVSRLPFDLTIGTGKKNGRRNPYGPSIDRIDPDKGYTSDNCRVVVWILNAAKGSWSMSDVIKLARALVKGCLLITLLYGCGDSSSGDECLARRDAAAPRLERAIGRYASAANGALDVVEGSGTWSCDGGPDVTVTLDFDLVFWDGVRHKTGVLTVWRDLEVFEVEDAENSL